jgi:murein DD-endopeptidase MepM/ murein hydrolase activator NlpD
VIAAARAGALLLACGCLAGAALGAAEADAAEFGARALKAGSKGKDVRVLQRALTALGYATSADGLFGPATRKNVKRLERKQKWPIDGRVTRKEARRILKLRARRKAPKASGFYFLGGLTTPAVTVTGSAGTGQLTVIDDATGQPAQTIALSFPTAGSATVYWEGRTAAGTWAGDSTYRFKIADPGTSGAQITGGQTLPFILRGRAFPVPGPHSFGGAGSRFGAPRAGHIHQGQDVAAACGQKLVAPELGTVTTKAYQAGGAGYYLVVHGALSGTDYVFMHMKKASWAPVGWTVHTGEGVGKVGNTGSSTGCHLHFERWTAPGWYRGGAAYDPLPELLAWDVYS